jgi:hypothetical protein
LTPIPLSRARHTTRKDKKKGSQNDNTLKNQDELTTRQIYLREKIRSTAFSQAIIPNGIFPP